MENRKTIWFITGISRGLGRELARAVLAQGDVVIGTTRDGKADLEPAGAELHVLPLEVTDRSQAKEIVTRAHELYGRLDVIVNNAGYGLLGAVEEASEAEARQVFEVNFWGTLNVIAAALPLLRAQRGGHIINLSSIAGLAPMAGSGLYAAAKSAVEGLSQSLAQEVGPLGIKVTVVEPGAFRTDFLSERSIRTSAARIEDYAPTAGAVVAYLEKIAGKQPGDPARGARAILEAARAEAPPMHLVLGTDALRRTREKQQKLAADLERWEGVARSTDFT